MGGNGLWVTGGISTDEGTSTSTEIIDIETEISRPGPDLPMAFWRHCMTWIDETRVALIGGNKGQTLIIDTNDFSMKMGPNTTYESVWHSCAKFSQQGKVASTQIWDPTSDQGWEKGPDLPNPCSYSSA